MSSSLRSSLIKMPIVVLLAASMGWLGLASMYWGSPYFPAVGEFWPNYVMLASVVLWVSASIALRGRDKSTWLAFGLVSPILGALLVAPPASFTFIIAKAYIAYPIGAATGMAMYYLDMVGKGSDTRKLA
ncbi:hypothetical protein SH139x_002626 [Planctomycetaceae bacterium SH139]